MSLWKLLAPRLYVDSILDIPIGQLSQSGIRGLIFDLDNTLIGWDRDRLDERTLQWFTDLQDQGFRLCLVSNNNEGRVTGFARMLGVPSISKAKKPRRRPFREALALLETETEETAVVGDQIFTDVLGGNRLGLYTILVVPISKREFVGTQLVRQVERHVLAGLKRRNLLP